jgi:hypothetical protein
VIANPGKKGRVLIEIARVGQALEMLRRMSEQEHVI